MTVTMTRETLSEHYKAVRTRLNKAPPQPTIQTEAPVVATVEPEPEPPPAPLPFTIPPPSPSARRYVHVLHDVAMRHAMTIDELISPCRKPRYVKARQEAYYLLRQENYSYPQIAQFCGNRDHTTIMHGIRQHEKNIGRRA